jgi:hypothetical protein
MKPQTADEGFFDADVPPKRSSERVSQDPIEQTRNHDHSRLFLDQIRFRSKARKIIAGGPSGQESGVAARVGWSKALDRHESTQDLKAYAAPQA